MSVNTKVNGQLVKSAGLYTVTKPIGMADIYSTEEKEVGLWVDNRPLYQKTYVFGADVTVSHDTFTNLTAFTIPTNIDYIRYAECFRVGNKGLLSIDCALVASGGSTYIAIRNSSAYDITVGSGSTLTITYTKSTDASWSGKFVPQGYGYVSSGDIYSFEERQVGVFADGKPLYQKTIDFGELPNNTVKQVNHNVSNIETVVEIKGVSYVNNLIYGENLPPVTASKTFRTSVRESVVEVSTTDNWTGYNARITFKYTKSTDAPGSGEYVPSGDKAVHYSTDEEVIGTFLGETLYRKVITGLNLQTAWQGTYYPNVNTSALISDTKDIINARAITNYNNGVSRSHICTIVTNSNNNTWALITSDDITINTLVLEYTKTS